MVCIFDEKYYTNLVTQKPIDYNGLTIYQPSFNDIIKLGLDHYNTIMQVYTLTLDCFDFPDGVEPKNLFDDIITENEYFTQCVGTSLSFLTKTTHVYFYAQNKSIVLNFDGEDKESKQQKTKDTAPKNEFIINSHNFDDICDIILKINSNNKIVVEKPSKNLSPKQLDVWKKLHDGRNRDDNKHKVNIYDVLNVCEFGGNYHIPIENICEWSLWRISNCYKARIDWKSYNDNLQIALVSGDSDAISGENHWLQKLTIR